MNGGIAGLVVVGLFVVLPLVLAAIIVAIFRKWLNPPIGSKAAKNYFLAMSVLGVFMVGFSLGIAVASDQVPWVLLVEGALFMAAGWYLVRTHDPRAQQS